jgi:hypothetical protein
LPSKLRTNLPIPTIIGDHWQHEIGVEKIEETNSSHELGIGIKFRRLVDIREQGNVEAKIVFYSVLSTIKNKDTLATHLAVIEPKSGFSDTLTTH